MKAFGNFRINAKSNFQSEGQAEQDDEGQILSLIFQCGFSEMVLLFFFRKPPVNHVFRNRNN